MINIAIVGATGYTGGELIKILLRHPHVRIKHVTSESSPGKRVDDVHSWLKGRCDLRLEKLNIKNLARDTDAAFFALPHGAGGQNIASYVKQGKKAIDLSADFRLRDIKTYQQWYKTKHASPSLVKKAVYGLPEIFREKIVGNGRDRPLIAANPGCYATAVILALSPLLKNNLVDPDSLVVDAKSGVSGAGKKLDLMYHFSEAAENFQAYAVGAHRHMPEIEQTLCEVSGKTVRITFVPHLLPMNRGILVSAYARLNQKATVGQIKHCFERDYSGETFIRFLPEGQWPQTKNTVHTNYCDINLKVDERTNRVIVLAALDNLVKGAAGQAVQNMNLLFGLDETEGLL